MKQAVILAGGKGTRLQERLNGLPKPLIDICGVPLLERQILLCKAYGFTDILILVNHAAEHIVSFCKAKKNWGLTVSCIDDGTPRGTAGAVLSILDRLDDIFLVMYGDTMLSVDLDRFWQYHRQTPSAGTLFLHPNDHPHDSDLVVTDEGGEILAFRPYPHPPESFEPNLVNAALYVLTKDGLKNWVGEATPLDFAKDLFPRMLAAGQKLRGYNSPEYIKDAGTPSRLDKVCADFLSGRIERARLDHPQKAIFLDRDGTLNEDRGYVAKPEDFALLPGVAEAVRRLNYAEYRTVVVTNQPVIARGDCSVEGLRTIHNKMETLLGMSGAYLDRIYYCPHHPDKGYAGEIEALKIKCSCRKPNIDMVERAKKDLNIDLAQSWFIGDTSVDMQTGARAGVKTILVETGSAGRDGKYTALPDFVMSDAKTAIDFILDVYPKLHAWAVSYLSTVKSGDMVFIGGAARSGKTTLTQTLSSVLREQGRRCLVLSIDRWLLSAEDRQETVLGRYDVAALNCVVEKLATRQGEISLSLPRYDKYNRRHIKDAETVTVPADAVVLIEGTIGLSLLKASFESKCHAVAVHIDEAVRRQRFMREYALRGYSANEAESLYQSRQEDEIPVLEKMNLVASTHVRFPLE